MAKKLSQITSLINGYLAKNFAATEQQRKIAPVEEFPAVIKVAILQGEAIIRTQFFETMKDVKIYDADSQMFLWSHLHENSKSLITLCERSGLNKFGSALLPQKIEQGYEVRCHNLFSCLVFDMFQRQDVQTAKTLIDLYIRHFSASLHKPSQPKTYEEKRKLIAQSLLKETGQKLIIKEHYYKEEDEFVFKLRGLKSKYDPKPICISMTRAKRYKNAKDKAYRLATEW